MNFSVRFYRRLIVIVTLSLLALSIALAIVFGVLYEKQLARSEELEIELATRPEAYASEETDISAASGRETQPQAYQEEYAYLYATGNDEAATYAEGEKVCYLTFDDGPSQTTEAILQTLEAYGIKATFFVTGENSEKYENVLRSAAQAGHTIGIHSYSHNYNVIYNTVGDFLKDFDQMYKRIIEVTGDSPQIYRFPGGSINAYNSLIYQDIIDEMDRRGFVYFDWNAAANDAVVGGITAGEIVTNVISSAGNRDRVIVLMHDRNENVSTAEALPAIIESLWREGYRLEALTSTVAPVTYSNLGDDAPDP